MKSRLVFTLIALMNVGCDRNEPAPTADNTAKAGDVEFILQVTDTQGNAQTIFREGDNFMLRFSIKNHSNREVKVCEGSFVSLVPDLFTVYRETGEGSGTELIGKPYESILTPCRIYTSSVLMAKSRQTIALPWLWGNKNNDQSDVYDTSDFGYYLDYGYGCSTSAHYSAQFPRMSALAPGEYFTQLSTTVNNRKIALRYDFTVK